MTLDEAQLEQIEKKAEYIKQKEALLTKRKALLEDLSYAQDSFEEGYIKEVRDTLAKKIKTLAANIRQIEAWETQA